MHKKIVHSQNQIRGYSECSIDCDHGFIRWANALSVFGFPDP